MSFTYLATLATPLDQTRFLIGDTDSTAPLFQDSEINGQLALSDSVPIEAAIALAMSLSARYSRRVTTSVDGLSFQYGAIAKSFADLAQTLRLQRDSGPGGLGVPVVGGVSKSDIAGVASNCDRVDSAFYMGLMNDPQIAPDQGTVPTDLETG